jgi:hypothetical protein
MWWWQIVVGVLAGLALVYLALLATFWHAPRRDADNVNCEVRRRRLRPATREAAGGCLHRVVSVPQSSKNHATVVGVLAAASARW